MNVRESSTSNTLTGDFAVDQERSSEMGVSHPVPVPAPFSPLSLAPLAFVDGGTFLMAALIFAGLVWLLFVQIPERRDARELEEQRAEERHWAELDVHVPVWTRTPLYDWHTEAPGTGVYGSRGRRSGDA